MRGKDVIVAEQGFYVGIDIDDTYAVASFLQDGMKEPATISLKNDAEIFQIPLCIGKKKGLGQWFIGDEAIDSKLSQEMIVVDHLLTLGLNQEEVTVEDTSYSATELLILFLKKMLGYIGGPYDSVRIDALAFCVEKLDMQIAKFLISIGEALGLKKEQILLLDRKSSFHYFALNQSKELRLHDISLFDYRDGKVKGLRLERNLNTIPQVVTIEEQNFEIREENRDEDFYQVLEQTMTGHVISSVYLVGDGFDGGWMKQSLAYLCRGRRAFVGKNLYAKGACYGASIIKDRMPWPYAYIGDSEMKVNVSLAVRNRGKKEFVTLLSAGDNWYEASGVCEVILDDTKEIAIWLQAPDSKTANVEKLTLSDLPEHENRTMRLRITVKPLSDKQVRIEIKDMGFGEIVKSKEKHWEYTMSV